MGLEVASNPTVRTLADCVASSRGPRGFSPGPFRNALEGLFEVGEQVANVFDATGQPDQAVAQPQGGPPFRWHRRVGHPGRLADERLDAAQRFGEREDAHPSEDVGCALFRPELHADHPAEARHLPLGQLVLRVRGEADVVHVLGSDALDEPPGDLAAVRVVLAHAQMQRLRSAQREPRVERTGDGARRVVNELQTRGEIVVAR